MNHLSNRPGVFDELETMVQNLGNSYIAKRNHQIRHVEYNPDSDVNVSKSSRHDGHYESIYAKCEYLETLNSNLIHENQKLKLDSGAQHRMGMTDHKTSQGNFYICYHF
jgi:hypothetical protein